ncbi:CD209 antigen-like protein E [Pempheris klunzingeri]|uniref:CD209 antigen-like protein E n=1 Tax=Pempheris klunzingeri TaxID=3127111 RepID=UPI0039810E29
MQQMEIADYVNERTTPRQKGSGNANQTERSLRQVLFLSFGMLCIIQAILNVSLRLTLYSSKESTPSDCNATHFSDGKQPADVQMDCDQRHDQHNRLQERFNALTRDKNLLENRNSELNNMIKDVEEERDRLKMKLSELGGSVSSQQCPAGWMEINCRCYFLSTVEKTWEDSRQYCRSESADLVVINDKQEQRALYRLDGNAHLLFWIGLYDTAGIFKWVDGSPLTQSFWQSGQPDHGGPNIREDCVEMYHFNPELANWNDAPCRHKLRWLCEKELN